MIEISLIIKFQSTLGPFCQGLALMRNKQLWMIWWTTSSQRCPKGRWLDSTYTHTHKVSKQDMMIVKFWSQAISIYLNPIHPNPSQASIPIHPSSRQATCESIQNMVARICKLDHSLIPNLSCWGPRRRYVPCHWGYCMFRHVSSHLLFWDVLGCFFFVCSWFTFKWQSHL